MVTNILSSKPQSSASAKEPFPHCLEIVKHTFFEEQTRENNVEICLCCFFGGKQAMSFTTQYVL